MKKIILGLAFTVTLSTPILALAQTFSSYSECWQYKREFGSSVDCASMFPGQGGNPLINPDSPTLNPAGDRTRITTDPPKQGSVNADLPNPLKAQSLIAVINGLATFMLEASILIATLLIIFGAFQILTSAGSEDKVASGKKTILYTVIGLGIMLLFKVILAVIAQLLGVQVNL